MPRVTPILPAVALALMLAAPAAANPTVTIVPGLNEQPGPVGCWSAGNCVVTESGDGDITTDLLLIHGDRVAGRERLSTGASFVEIDDALSVSTLPRGITAATARFIGSRR